MQRGAGRGEMTPSSTVICCFRLPLRALVTTFLAVHVAASICSQSISKGCLISFFVCTRSRALGCDCSLRVALDDDGIDKTNQY